MIYILYYSTFPDLLQAVRAIYYDENLVFGSTFVLTNYINWCIIWTTSIKWRLVI